MRSIAPLLASALLAALTLRVSGHGGLFIPTPRNSEDNALPQFAGGKSPTTACTCTNGNGNTKEGCDRGLRAAADGQNCLWWSQGCSIGCKECATEAFPRGPFSGCLGDGPKSPGCSKGKSGKIGFATRYCNASYNSAGAPVALGVKVILRPPCIFD